MSTVATMPPATLAALQASIAHWERAAVSDWDKEPVGCKECALCGLFRYQPWGTKDCTGCPIYEAYPERQYCRGTPYVDAETAMHINDIAAFRDAAQREVKFLKGLLPKEGGAK